MPCCAKHDRLDQILHAVEFTEQRCGAVKLDTLDEILPGIAAVSPTRVLAADKAAEGSGPYIAPDDPNHQHVAGYGKPYYCCFDCPTLLINKGGALQRPLLPEEPPTP